MSTGERSGNSLPGDTNELVLLRSRISELERANESLRRENAELRLGAHAAGDGVDARSVIDGIPGFIAILMPDGRNEFVNRQIHDYCGVADDAFENWGTDGIVHPDDVEHVAEGFASAIAAGTPYEFDMRMRRSDGVYRWFHSRGVPVRGSSGQIARWYVLLVDIDDRRKAEEALREKERETRLIVDNIAGLVAIMAPDGELLDVNQQFLTYSGHSFEEHKRWDKIDFVHPDDTDKVRELRARRTHANEPYEYELRLRRFDGAYRWFLNRVVPVLDEAGNVRLWFVLVTDIDERIRAENERRLAKEALAASERNLRLIVDTMPALSWSARPDGAADFFNEHYLKYVGLSGVQAEGWGWTVAVHPDDLGSLAAVWQSILASGVPGEAEARLRRYDGQYRWFLLRASPLRNERGLIVKWYGVNTDIEDRKAAEERLRDSEREARLIVDTIPGQVAVLLPSGAIETVNQQLAAYCGKSTEGLQNWGSDGTVHPDDVPVIGPIFVRSLETGVPYDYECRIRRFDGVYRWFQVRGLPLRDAAGRIGRWYVLLTDVDDRKRAEVELRRAYDSFADAQRLSRTGSFITDIVADEHNWSDEAYRIFEFERGSKVSVQRIREIVHPDDLQPFDFVIQQGSDGRDVHFDFRVVTPSGALKHIRGLAHVIERVAGRPMFVGALQDVTETRNAEEALNRTRSELAHVARVTALSTLTASIAHEVSQPLAGIMTNANTCLLMLAADPPNIDGARETVRRTLRDGNRASEVVTRLRALFRKDDITTDAVDLNEAAREVIALSLGELRRNSVFVRSDLGSDVSPVVGDRVQLQQVILNLLLNASDAMRGVNDRPRQIVITTNGDQEGNTRLTVRDTGVGIDPDSARKLFDAFYTTKAGGMGIGLSVSRSIVERHGGRLWATPNDGPGATFSFSIPNRSSCEGEHAMSPTN